LNYSLLYAVKTYHYSLLHINDQEAKDFSECEGCVHVIDILDRDEEIKMEAIETDVSMMASGRILSSTLES
jgi:hypothetical protein